MALIKIETESREDAAKRLLIEKQTIISEIDERGDVFSSDNNKHWERIREIGEYFSAPFAQDVASRPLPLRREIVVGERIRISLPPRHEVLFVRTRNLGGHA